MSWNIFIYAEVKSKKETDFKPLVIPAICDDFKFLDVDFVCSLPTMSAKNSTHPTVKDLDNGLYGSDFTVQYCTVKDLRKYYHNIIDDFKIKCKAVYLALGLKVDLSEDWYDVSDDYCDDDNDCNKSCMCNMWNKMTFPVNKEMFRDLLNTMEKCHKAYQVLGMCDTIESMCENYDDEVRLTFATL